MSHPLGSPLARGRWETLADLSRLPGASAGTAWVRPGSYRMRVMEVPSGPDVKGHSRRCALSAGGLRCWVIRSAEVGACRRLLVRFGPEVKVATAA